MGQKLLGYPMFLAYFTSAGTTIIAGIAYFIESLRRKREKRKKIQQKQLEINVAEEKPAKPPLWKYHYYYALVPILCSNIG